MYSMINAFLEGGNETLTLVFLSLACMRVYLEIISFDFLKLPISRALAQRGSNESLIRFHKMGLIFSIGYILITAPTIFFS